MPVSRRLEVKRTVILEFSLPGTSVRSTSYSSGRPQLEEHSESYVIHVNQENAADTANVFEDLARAIRETAL